MGPRAAIPILVVLAALLAAAPAGAATFTVRNAGDAGDAAARAACVADAAGCTLRAAILEANAGGVDHTIQFAVSSVPVPTALPEIESPGVFLDGCNKGRSQDGLAIGPDATPCTELRGTGSPTGFVIRDVSGARVQGFFVTGFPGIGVHLWGTTGGWIRGNRFGLRADNTAEANGRAIRITGRSQNGTVVTRAKRNTVGGGSAAADSPASCTFLCNMIVNSTIPGPATGIGIDLVGLAQGTGPGDVPAGGAPEDVIDGTTIYGNWIGVRTASGTPAANEKAILVGGAQQTSIGNENEENANVIAGNDEGIDQGAGQGAVTLMRGLYGLSPDRQSAVSNGPYHARLRGGADGVAWVWDATFGPAPIGLELTGPGAEVYGSWFTGPEAASSARFTTAAIRLGPDADGSFIGAPSVSPVFGRNSLVPDGCLPLFFSTVLSDACNAISWIGPDGAGVLVEGADDVNIARTATGAPLGGVGEVDGVPIRVRGDGADPATGIAIGSEDAKGWNDLWRKDGPAVEVGAGTQGVTIAGNGGLASTSFTALGSRFTDLVPPVGVGNATANNGVQPPVVTQATVDGIAGTAAPNAVIRVLQQQRPIDPETVPSDPPPGYTYPPTETTVSANGAGVWGLTFPENAVLAGQALLASQTVGDSTSEFAASGDVQQTEPDPVASFTSGPTGLVTVTTATFTFVSDTVGATFLCSLDGGAFAPCSSPHTVGPLEPGGHQLQVKAVDPLGTIGPPVSRTWTIELPGQTAAPGTARPLGGGAGAAGAGPSSAVALSSVVALPSARRCVSRRALRIRLRAPKGTKIAFARIDGPGKRSRTVRGQKLSAPVDLRGLPRGRFTVRFRVTLLDGRVVKGSRTFRTCAPKRR